MAIALFPTVAWAQPTPLTFTLQGLTPQEFVMIDNALADSMLPHKSVVDLMRKLEAQALEQQNAQRAPTPDLPKAPQVPNPPPFGGAPDGP